MRDVVVDTMHDDAVWGPDVRATPALSHATTPPTSPDEHNTGPLGGQRGHYGARTGVARRTANGSQVPEPPFSRTIAAPENGSMEGPPTLPGVTHRQRRPLPGVAAKGGKRLRAKSTGNAQRVNAVMPRTRRSLSPGTHHEAMNDLYLPEPNRRYPTPFSAATSMQHEAEPAAATRTATTDQRQDGALETIV